jgi:hypothetical protein
VAFFIRWHFTTYFLAMKKTPETVSNSFSEQTNQAILHNLHLIAGCDKMLANFRAAGKTESSPQIFQEKRLKKQYCTKLTKLLQAQQLHAELIEA